MYNTYMMYPCSYYANIPMYNPYDMYSPYDTYSCPCFVNTPSYNDSDFSMQRNNRYIPFTDEFEYASRFGSPESVNSNRPIELKDYGPQPFVVNINEATKRNDTFRTALWTGTHLQVTLMSINVGDDIGLEMHPNVDQFIRIEEGQGLVKMGSNKDRLNFRAKAYDDFAIMIPAGTWHNIINTGNKPLKAYSIYAPPQHPHGTVHVTKADAEAAEESHH
ncbi:cupin domain-containing protein [Clostridium botulinum]|uniref:Cupin domain-containing protein n=1 Tax=Clostridium botulinum TaxID=1491 RepID=A0A6G4EDU0_CLOBO|nr:cupin domain-containing protein [Clostridium botulinum]APH20620.1 cupin domain protein [Clostridium botulinum]AUM89988.1 cupin [Clostridium botulinum]NFB14252.1 cupin domain-containing protein [Clostridium botulinum]NFH58462.1 cupin domain-containing protein [Clostridium botulinum]NFH61411.1 cupin domain-containing protein [Clostridium botulinum]